MEGLGYIITAVSLVCSILLLTGHGSFLLQQGGADRGKKLHDEKKLSKACGIALLITGIASLIDCFTTAMPLKIAYIVVIFVVFAVLFWYIAKKCRL
ncbi:MAG: DUF3784 domain-containing protein [Blautia sp.]|nr:DUF3784 domain-containing protein [Blautia sp.]